MTSLLSFVPALLTVLVVGCFLKLAARLFRRTVLSWRHSLLFGLLLLGVAIAKSATGLAFSLVVPPAAGMILGMALSIALGAWFFSTRAKTVQGESIGWRGGLTLTSIAVGLMAGLGLSLMLLANALRPFQP
jgi:hypothetical protein